MMLDEKETGAMRSCLDRLHSCIKGKRVQNFFSCRIFGLLGLADSNDCRFIE